MLHTDKACTHSYLASSIRLPYRRLRSFRRTSDTHLQRTQQINNTISPLRILLSMRAHFTPVCRQRTHSSSTLALAQRTLLMNKKKEPRERFRLAFSFLRGINLTEGDREDKLVFAFFRKRRSWPSSEAHRDADTEPKLWRETSEGGQTLYWGSKLVLRSFSRGTVRSQARSYLTFRNYTDTL
jgi:hypothetical protein